MKKQGAVVALRRVLDALETELLNAPSKEIAQIAVETGMIPGTLVADMRQRLDPKAILRPAARPTREDPAAEDDQKEIASPAARPPDAR